MRFSLPVSGTEADAAALTGSLKSTATSTGELVPAE